jgi:histidinol-phosphate aminotransferase
MKTDSASRCVRPLVRALSPYVPGEQPKVKGLIKLNTNENPFPPAPAVLREIKAAVDGRLRLYPHPTAEALREELARYHKCTPEQILVGNGSDEVLALAVRAFVEPVGVAHRVGGSTVQFFDPSYSLYEVLAATHGSRANRVPLEPNFDLPSIRTLRRERLWEVSAALTFITTPNAPSGRGYSIAQLEEICQLQKGVVLLDEAYVEFAPEHAMSLALRYPRVLVARTFSKAYSLCFQRVGYVVGNPVLIAALHKIRDSYNVNGLGQVAALATLRNLGYYRAKFQEIIHTRETTSEALRELGFEVLPSQTNFILARPPGPPAEQWLEQLKAARILVRWFRAPAVSSFLRITIGTAAEMRAFVAACRRILAREAR